MNAGSVTDAAAPPRQPPGGGAAAPAAALLAAVLAVSQPEATQWERFLAEPDWARALVHWLGPATSRDLAGNRRALLQRLDRDIVRLDEFLTRQVNAILQHAHFQALEASWRGLRYLTERAVDAHNVKIRLLNVSWRELARDLERAIEFDQSQLFKKVYSEEFDMPGGEPFGLLIGDYQVRHRPGLEHPVDDVAVLRGISQVAAAAFAPFVAGAHPALFGLDSFRELGLPIDLQAVFRQLEYLPWRSLRESEDARFVGLTLPRILLRIPYEDDGSRVDGFHFHEDVEGSDNSRYLWGNAAYAFAAVAIQAFDSHGWLADIRGVRQDPIDHHLIAGGGLVSGLSVHSCSTDRSGLIPKYSTDVLLTAEREKELEELGFIPLCHCWDTEWSAFYSNASVQAPKRYDTVAATVNARLSAMLQYTLCVARFAHYLKLLGRAKTGSFTRSEELQNYLQTWLQQYTTARDSASYTDKARYPLREARVQFSEHPGKPGCYLCVAHLRPHFQLEQLIAAIKLETEITPVE